MKTKHHITIHYDNGTKYTVKNVLDWDMAQNRNIHYQVVDDESDNHFDVVTSVTTRTNDVSVVIERETNEYGFSVDTVYNLNPNNVCVDIGVRSVNPKDDIESASGIDDVFV